MAPDTSFDRLHFSVQQVFAEIRIVWQLVDEKLGRKYLELDDALFRVMDDIAEAMYMKGAADREMMIR